MASGWVEQFERVDRWYQRFAAINAGRAHDVASEHYIDDVYAFFQNCYHLKDWLQNDRAVPQRCKDALKLYVKGDRSLRLCADLCNGLKHLGLNRHPKSHESPTFGGKHYAIDVGTAPTTISLTYEIDTSTGREDAFTLATRCVDAWKSFLQTQGLRSLT